MERALIKLGAFCEKFGCIPFRAQFGSIISEPCPIGLVILRIKATKKENEQLTGDILSCRILI